jgi:Asp-tRNA(Asn)/Glu-tRNA(Gln) amidotransferase C subunit
MNDDEIKEFSLLDDEQTKVLEWFEDHPEEREKFIETMNKVMESIGQAIAKVTEQLSPTIEAFAALGAACAEAKRIEEEDPEDD